MKRTLTIITLTVFMACGKKSIPLKNGYSSIEALAADHLNCIVANDAACLHSQLLSLAEFHNSVYPYLPEAKDGSIAENDYWGWTLPDRQKAVKKLLERFGGSKFTSLRIGQPKKVLNLGPLKLHRDVPLYAIWTDEKSKNTETLSTSEILKAVVEINGEYKLWNMTYE